MKLEIGLIVITVVLVAFMVFLAKLSRDHSIEKAKEDLAHRINYWFCPGNIFRWFDRTYVQNGTPDPFTNNFFCLRVIEVREAWVMYELEEFEQKEGMASRVKTSIETGPCEDVYKMLQKCHAMIIKDCNKVK